MFSVFGGQDLRHLGGFRGKGRSKCARGEAQWKARAVLFSCFNLDSEKGGAGPCMHLCSEATKQEGDRERGENIQNHMAEGRQTPLSPGEEERERETWTLKPADVQMWTARHL